jgi:hypothetical protein
MEITHEYWSKYIVFCFVSNGISVCTIIIAEDTVLVQLEATVPVVTVESYRLCRVTTLKNYGNVRVMCFVGNKL